MSHIFICRVQTNEPSKKKKWHGIFVNAIIWQIQGGPSTLSIYKKRKKEKIIGEIIYCIGLQLSQSSAQFD